MFSRMRITIIAAVTAVMLLSSALSAFATPSPEQVRQLRADVLSARGEAPSGLRAASAETTIAVLGSAWYKDVNGQQHFDGYFSNGGTEMYQDVWVMVEFKDDMGMTIGTEELMSNEYVVEGVGTWSAEFPMVPAGTVGAQAMVFGTPTSRMAFMPASFTAPEIHLLAGTDRHIDGSVTFGMVGMEGDPTLGSLSVSVAEDHMGEFHDVASGTSTSTTSSTLLPGIAAPWRAWGARPADMATDLRFVSYSAVEFSTITSYASTKVPAYGAAVALTGRVLNSAGAPVSGIPVAAFTSAGAVAGQTVSGVDGAYAISVKPSVKTIYTLVSLGDSYLDSAVGAPITIDPKVYLSTPSAPSAVRRYSYFTSAGNLKPRHTAGTYPVLIKAYLKVNGKWVLKKTIKAKASNYYSYSKYTARYNLPARGYWKLVATHDSSAHYPSASGARYITVR